MHPALSVAVSLTILDRKRSVLFAAIAVLAWLSATLSMLLLRSNGIPVFVGLVVLTVVLDTYTVRRTNLQAGRRVPLHYLGASMAALLFGYGIWWLDKLGIWCDPHNHYFNGHFVWHCFCGIAIALHFRHLEAKLVRARVQDPLP
jgi:hypothetical protein